MAEFVYKALDAEGGVETGVVSAPDRVNAARALARRGVFPTELSESARRGTGLLDALSRRGRRVSVKERAAFTRNLATLLASGVPLVRALAVARQHAESAGLREAVDDIIGKMRGGEAFSTVLAGHEGAFDRSYASIIRAGEAAGALPEALRRLGFFLEREARLRSDIATAMLYPVIVLSLTVLFVSVILGVVLPGILSEITSMVTELPWPTRVLLGAGRAIGRWWPAILVVAGAAAGLFVWIGRTRAGRLRIDSLKLRLPLVGSAIRKVAVGRFARTLGVLARNGVPILESLAIAGQTAGNARISRAVVEITRNVRGGAGLAAELDRTNEFPALLVNMTAVGEETGKLDMVLMEAAEAYDQDVGVAIARVNAVLPAVLIIFVGAIIAFAVAGVILPIVEVQSAVSLH